MSLPWHVAPSPQTRRRYLCCRAPGGAAIDGRLDKPFWNSAPWSEEFVDIEGDAKPLPPFRTRFKMVWDDECLYVGAEMEEPHVWGSLAERDSIVYHDNDFEVFLNPTGDNHNYYEIEVNALNTIFHLFLPRPYRDGGPADHGWDAVGMQTAVHVKGTLNDPSDIDRGWSVELAIPWRAFDRHATRGEQARAPKPGDQWRMNFSRVQWDHEVASGSYRKIPGRPEHNWVWSPQGIVDMHRPEQWGYVQFGSGTTPTEPVRDDPTLPARDLLHAVYYAQRVFRKMHRRCAIMTCELLSTGHFDSAAAARIELAEHTDGWRATIRPASPAEVAVSIDHESRVTFAP